VTAGKGSGGALLTLSDTNGDSIQIQVSGNTATFPGTLIGAGLISNSSIQSVDNILDVGNGDVVIAGDIFFNTNQTDGSGPGIAWLGSTITITANGATPTNLVVTGNISTSKTGTFGGVTVNGNETVTGTQTIGTTTVTGSNGTIYISGTGVLLSGASTAAHLTLTASNGTLTLGGSVTASDVGLGNLSPALFTGTFTIGNGSLVTGSAGQILSITNPTNIQLTNGTLGLAGFSSITGQIPAGSGTAFATAAQGIQSFTTTGTSGAATFSGGALNIPQYSGGSGSGIPVVNGTGQGTTLTGTTAVSALNGAIINVKAAPYDATGNGTTDDTAALDAAIGTINSGTGMTLYFPPGTYLTGTGLSAITNPFILLGSGKIGPAGLTANQGSTIVCSSATATCINITSRTAAIRDIAVVNSYSNPTSSAGIVFAPANKNDHIDYDNVTVSGFYIDINQEGCEYGTVNNCNFYGFVGYGMIIRNLQNSDYGDWTINETNFSADVYTGGTGVWYQSSGGGKFTNDKFNAGYTSGNMGTCIAVTSPVSGSSTIICLISNCSLENYNTAGIYVNAPYLPDISISGCEFGQWNGSGDTTAIPMDITNTSNVTVGTNIIDGFGTTAAVNLSGVTNATIYPQTLATGRSYTQLSQTSCSAITVISGTSGTILSFGAPVALADGATVTGTCNAGYVNQTWTLAHSGTSTVTFAQPANLTAGMQGAIQVTDASSATYNFPSGWVSSGGVNPESLTMTGTATFAWLSLSSTNAIVSSGTYAN